MAALSITYTFTNETPADATQMNQNFSDIINALTDGTKDLTVNLFQATGAATFTNNVTLGNATGDDITFTGRVASDIDPKTAATNTLGDATQTWRALYLDNTTTDGGAIYFDGGSTEFIKANAAGTLLQLGGFSALDLSSGQYIKNLVSAKSANYTVLDNDGIRVFLVTTGASDVTITLPTPADNTGRIYEFKKVDSGAGRLLISEETSETIDGFSTIVVPLQYDCATICTGPTSHSVLNKTSTGVWTAFTPSWSNIGTTSANNGVWRRVGDSMEIEAYFIASAAGSGGAIILTVPSSLNINTSAVSAGGPQNGRVLGSGIYIDSGTTTKGLWISYSDSTSLFMIKEGEILDSIDGVEIASGDELGIRCTIPISEWANIA